MLEELGDSYHNKEFFQANIRALGIYVRTSIEALSKTAKEVVIDATFGTNNVGMDLYAVLAELDGIWVPLAYLFIEKDNSTGSTRAGTMTQILDQFLRPLNESGLAPSFVGCDKDKSEINAIQQVWPSAKVQLCYWHAKRVVQTKLKDSCRTNSLARYTPEEAKAIVPNLEICWGSHPTKRLSKDHRYD